MATESTDDISPEKFNLPKTHEVQALETRYIRSDVLTKVLDQMWGAGNWALEVSRSFSLVYSKTKQTTNQTDSSLLPRRCRSS
jgi:hypothetical protein